MRSRFFVLLVFLAANAFAQKPAGKIGYVDIERLVAQLPETKQMEARLVEMRTKLSEDFQAKQQQFEKLYTFYTTNGTNLVDSTRQKLEYELQLMDQEIQQFDANAQSTFDNTRKLYMAPVYLKLGSIIQQVSIANGYSMIIPTRIKGTLFVLYADPKTDVTDLIAKKFAEVPDKKEPEKK